MREMLWAKPPTTIEMFTIKKHMQEIPALKNKNLSTMTRGDYKDLQGSDWAKILREQRPSSFYSTITRDDFTI